MDTKSLIELSFGLIGGLGIFLLGMRYMSEGMQAIAGDNLRRLINAVTNNRFMATGVGTLVTCVVQSSSVTTVLVIGSVNGGLMNLSQAIGVIMGANIGTTITGWILVLKIGKYGLPLLGAMALVYLFIKGDRWRFWALSLMGVGMVFFGLELMKDACAIIKEMPDFEAWFQKFDADNYFGVFKCIMVGCILTIVVQSSSATLGITISLATQGIISFETAAALVLGENIGTTITAYLASLGATVNARRAAYFHMIFNLVGVLWITAIFYWYTDLVQWLVSSDVNKIDVQDGVETYPNMTAHIAATHSIFNVTNTLLFLPFVGVFVRLLERIVPSKDFKEKPHLTDLDIRMLESPPLAIEQSRYEIIKMSDGCDKMLDWLRTLLPQSNMETLLMDRIIRREKVLDNIQDEIAIFMTGLLSNNIPHRIAVEGRKQLRISDEYESLSDYIVSIMKFNRRLHKEEHAFSEEQTKLLLELHDMIAEYLKSVNEAFNQQNKDSALSLAPTSKRIRKKIKELRSIHLESLSSGVDQPPQVGVAFMAALNAYARVRDHAENITEAICDDK